MDKAECYRQYNNAINAGVLVRPETCIVCGCSDGTIHGHHPDYEKPLRVLWLCAGCHSSAHATMRVRADQIATPPLPRLVTPDAHEHLARIGAKGGHAGLGKWADPEKMRRAAQARWAKHRAAKATAQQTACQSLAIG